MKKIISLICALMVVSGMALAQRGEPVVIPLWPLHPKTPPLHPCSVARNPLFSYPKPPFGISHFTIWDVPFYHLGYPISPFGVSHFTIWDVPFYHLGYPFLPFGVSHFAIWDVPFHLLGYIFGTFAHNVQPRFSVCLLRFSLQKFVCFFPFGSSCFS